MTYTIMTLDQKTGQITRKTIETNLELPADQPKQVRGFCGLTAMAVFTGYSFEAVKQAYQIGLVENDRKTKRSNWKGTTNVLGRNWALEVMDVDFETTMYRRGEQVSLEKWVARHAKPGATYMITTTGHVQVVRDGVVIDQRGPRYIKDYSMKGKKVRAVTVMK